MKYNCLIIDDEISIAETTCDYFNMFDIKSAYATSYEEGIKFLSENDVSLLLLDINLGESSGFELCKKVRETSNMPILFISARTSDDDVLTALNIGGDDYIKKPYSLNILLAKVKAILKRYTSDSNLVTCSTNLKLQNLELDYNYHQVLVNSKPIKLKEMEFRLLSYLIENKNRVLSKDELFENVWKDTFISDGTLNVHIRRLREKIEANANSPTYIKTVWGIGYVFEVKE
ncbi:DNA-binding response regulator [Clostridium gelidum]|uniref:Stage 0 sporulation protein A homolog n=1 Tax=Clostridium gelidum TaxID=704125 RepID=A0ABN6J010_9CLOT|nr:response regulator transcription factor [Clostridium gelidum]BCZ47706.1 DNA-binding response regulator [Clostridium gelidum]